jgi:hypothetical protein
MRGNQLPVSADRSQHGSHICFADFILEKNHEMAKHSTTAKAIEKISTDLESIEF